LDCRRRAHKAPPWGKCVKCGVGVSQPQREKESHIIMKKTYKRLFARKECIA